MSKHTPINGLPPCAAAIMRFLSPHKTEAALQTRHRRLCLTGISTATARSMLALLLILSGAGTAYPLRAQQSQAECWIDDEGLWAWGFAEKFAIHDNRPWQYESVRKDGDRRTLTLRHDDERLSADFRQTSDSTCTIAVDGGRPLFMRRPDAKLTLANFARVQLYSVSGQLLHDATCDAAFAYPAAKGIYLLRIGGEAYKVAVK